MLVEESSDSIDQRGPRLAQLLADAMQGLEVLLLHPFDGYKAHRRPRNGLTDGFGISRIAFSDFT